MARDAAAVQHEVVGVLEDSRVAPLLEFDPDVRRLPGPGVHAGVAEGRLDVATVVAAFERCAHFRE